MKKQIAIFASGSGSNAVKIIEYFKHSELIEVRLVISNKVDAPVLAKAEVSGVKTHVIDRTSFYQSQDILQVLADAQIELLVLAGFLWLVPGYLVEAYPHQIINIHPALLPDYGGKGMYGMRVHEAVKAAEEPQTGITIHYVNKQYDEGEIIFQASCEVLPIDTPESIAHKVQQLEHTHFAPIIERVLTQ